MIRSIGRTLSVMGICLGSVLGQNGHLAGDVVSISAIDCGFYNSVGRHSKLDGSPFFGGATPATFNYSVGTIDEGPPFPADPDVYRKNYFTFDLTSYAPGDILAASLDLYLPVDGYSGPATLTYALYGSVVPGPPGMSILASELTGVYSPFIPAELAKATGLYTKIGDMHDVALPPLAMLVATEADEGTLMTISFTPFGVSYLNSFAGGKVVMGGMLLGLPTTGPPDDPSVYLWGFSSPVIPGVVPWDMSGVTPTLTPALTLSVVPEPGLASLGFVAMLTLVSGLRSRRSPGRLLLGR